MNDPTRFAKQLFHTIDETMSGLEFSKAFTPDGQFQMGNESTVFGILAITQYVDQFFCRIRKISHDIHNVWMIDNILISELTVTYVREQGDSMTFPAVTIWRIDGELIRSYKAYVDNHALFASL